MQLEFPQFPHYTAKYCTTMWKIQKFTLTLFRQKFHESNIFTKEITTYWFDEKLFQCCKKNAITSLFSEESKIFPSIQHFYYYIICLTENWLFVKELFSKSELIWRQKTLVWRQWISCFSTLCCRHCFRGKIPRNVFTKYLSSDDNKIHVFSHCDSVTKSSLKAH